MFIRRMAGLILYAVMAQMTYEKYQKWQARRQLGGKAPTAAMVAAEAKKSAEKKAFLKSYMVMVPLGLVGGVLSYVAGNMGPILNVYLVLLALPKYEMVGTRAAIFIPIDAAKAAGKYFSGHLFIPYIFQDYVWVFDQGLQKTGLSARFNIDPLPAGWGTPATPAADYGLYFGLRMGIVGIFGVLVAKSWLRVASPEFFQFIYERVTYCMTGLMGTLLVVGSSITDLIKMASPYLPMWVFDEVSRNWAMLTQMVLDSFTESPVAHPTVAQPGLGKAAAGAGAGGAGKGAGQQRQKEWGGARGDL